MILKTLEEVVEQLDETLKGVKDIATRVANVEAAMEQHIVPVLKEHEDRLDFLDVDVRAVQKDLDMLRDEIRQLKESNKKDMDILTKAVTRVVNRESACGLTVDRIEALVVKVLGKVETDKEAKEKLFREQEEREQAKAATLPPDPSSP